jgi:hypothetical protein
MRAQARRGFDLEGTLEGGVAGKPEHEVGGVLLAEIYHFRTAVVTVATQGDPGVGQCRRMRRTSRRKWPATSWADGVLPGHSSTAAAGWSRR